MEQTAAMEQVMEILVRSLHSDLEEVAFACPGLTWNQVFLAIDLLRRQGAVNLQLSGPGRYTVSVPNYARRPFRDGHAAGQSPHG